MQKHTLRRIFVSFYFLILSLYCFIYYLCIIFFSHFIFDFIFSFLYHFIFSFYFYIIFLYLYYFIFSFYFLILYHFILSYLYHFILILFFFHLCIILFFHFYIILFSSTRVLHFVLSQKHASRCFCPLMNFIFSLKGFARSILLVVYDKKHTHRRIFVSFYFFILSLYRYIFSHKGQSGFITTLKSIH